VTLFNRAFSRGLPPDLDTRMIADADDLASVLRDEFTLDLTADEVAAIWKKVEDAPVSR
jgi:N-hydroxyarylamine O-acetyltransferase